MNNKFGDCCNCPALEDGRFLTRYDDRIEIDLEIMKKNNISNSLALRKYLIDNASTIIDSNIKNIEVTSKCNYNKPRDAPAAAINTSYYVNNVIYEPTDNNFYINSNQSGLNMNSPS
jgi:hypothetical protein